MANFKTFYKIVQPRPATSELEANQEFTSSATYANSSWYQNIVKGAPARQQQYMQYESMDQDVEVSRALHTIAAEMTGNDPKNNDPIDIELLTTDKTKYDSTEVITLKAALSRWNMIHDWESKLFSVCRTMIKHGDVFFRKQKKFDAKWEYIHPKNVVAAIVDKNDATRVLFWQIRTGIKKTPDAGVAKGSESVMHAVNTGNSMGTELVPATEIVQFTLNDEMSDCAPFGESVLQSVYKAHKQKELLEDAIIIYRVQRAPERRVFYIDVGKMPAMRAKAHLEQYKNEIRQKKIPSFGGGKQKVDSVYNPQSMNEDFFLTVRPEGRGSRIETLPGGASTGETNDLEYFRDKVWEGLNIPRSYMMGQENGGGAFADGKVGVAYIEELRFAQYIGRLQKNIENKLDREFKKFLRTAKINIDPLLYRLRLPAPSNFGMYRQQEMDGQLLSSYGSAEAIPYLSKRFSLGRYLQLSDEEIVMNERMLREEKGLPLDDNSPKVLAQIYGSTESMENLDGGFGGSSLDTTSDTENLDDIAPEGEEGEAPPEETSA